MYCRSLSDCNSNFIGGIRKKTNSNEKKAAWNYSESCLQLIMPRAALLKINKHNIFRYNQLKVCYTKKCVKIHSRHLEESIFKYTLKNTFCQEKIDEFPKRETIFYRKEEEHE